MMLSYLSVLAEAAPLRAMQKPKAAPILSFLSSNPTIQQSSDPTIQPFQKPTVAILPFVGTGVSQTTVDLLPEFLWQELNSSGAFSLTDGNTLKSTLATAGYAETKCFDLTCARNFGQALGVEKVLIGQVTKAGAQYRLEIKTVDLAARQETFSEAVQVPSEDALFSKLADLTGRITEALKQPAATAPRPPESKTVTPSPTPPTPAKPQLQIIHQPIQQATADQAIQVTAQVKPALGENELFLIYRPLGEERFRFTTMKRVVAEEYYAEIPSEAIGAKGVEYYLRAIDRSSNELGRFPAGNAYLSVNVTARITERPTPPPTPSREKKKGGKKWLWIAGGGAVAAGLAALLASSSAAAGGGDGERQTLPGPPNYP
jgi:TolB-like protein